MSEKDRSPTNYSENGKLIPVFILGKVSSATVNNFLRHAYENNEDNLGLHIVGNIDSSTAPMVSRPPLDDLYSPFERHGTFSNGPRDWFLHQQTQLRQNLWMVLDAGTSDAHTLSLGWLFGWHQSHIRTDFQSSLRAAARLLHGQSTADLKNDAQITGGVLRVESLSMLEKQWTQIDAGEYTQHPLFATHVLDRFDGYTGLPLWPVFCTTDLSADVLEDFVEQAHGNKTLDMGPSNHPARPGLAIVTSLNPEECDAVKLPFSASGCQPLVIKTSPQGIDRIVKSRFPDSKLHPNQFIILDETAIKDRLALIADNAYDELVLARVRFDKGLLTLVAIGPTSLRPAVIVTSGARYANGISPES